MTPTTYPKSATDFRNHGLRMPGAVPFIAFS